MFGINIKKEIFDILICCDFDNYIESEKLNNFIVFLNENNLINKIKVYHEIIENELENEKYEYDVSENKKFFDDID